MLKTYIQTPLVFSYKNGAEISIIPGTADIATAEMSSI